MSQADRTNKELADASQEANRSRVHFDYIGLPRRARWRLSRPARRKRASFDALCAREPGPRGNTASRKTIWRFALFALGPGSRSARASALAILARDTGHSASLPTGSRD